MSSKLQTLDLSSASVGTTGTIAFPQYVKFAANNIQNKAHIWLFNESGCGLDILFQQSNNSHYLPAGGWGTFDVEPNDGSIKVTVTYTLPNPPVSSLNAIYYAPGELVPPGFTLGNSPIGIGGTVNTSSIQTLSNEGNSANTLVIDVGDTSLTQLITFFTDHFILKVDQSGVAHGVIKGSTTGNAAQIGQTGDTSEVLGSLLVDQNETVTGTLTITGDATFNGLATAVTITNNALIRGILNVSGVLNANGGVNANTLRDDTNGNTALDMSAGTGDVAMPHKLSVTGITTLDAGAVSTITTNGSGQLNLANGILDLRGSQILNYTGTNTHLTVPTAAAITFDVNSITTASVGTNGIQLDTKKISDNTGVNIADWSGAGCFFKGNPANNGPLQYYADGTNMDWRYIARSEFSGTGSVTANHGLKYKGAGITPQSIQITQGVQAVGSQTQGCNTTGATQTNVVSGNAAAWTAIASSS